MQVKILFDLHLFLQRKDTKKHDFFAKKARGSFSQGFFRFQSGFSLYPVQSGWL